MKKNEKVKIDTGTAGRLANLRKDLRQFRFQSAGSRAKNVHAGKNIRREIARLLTAAHGIKA